MPVRWVFRSYWSTRKVSVLVQWYEGLPLKAQAKFDARLRYLQVQPVTGWVRPYFDRLEGEYAGLGELRFESSNVQHRPIGFISGIQEFTFVFPEATERDGKWHPPTALAVAKARRAEIQADRRNSCDYEF